MTETISQYHAVRPEGDGFAVVLATLTGEGRTERIITLRDTFEQATDEMNQRNEVLFGGKYHDRDHGPVFVSAVSYH